ncbi:MAG: trigger factor, partial [Ruminococcus sp.]|nr:trigger factor [Ruminococcus sp.]
CKLKAISYEELPEINDDLVKDATEFETVAEYKDDIKTKLEEAAVQQADSAFENAVMEALISKVDAPIPNCMYEQRIDSLMRSFEQQLQQQGMDIKLYFQYTGMDMDSFRETYRDRAVNEVKLRLALEKIADLENIQISDEDLNNSLGEIAAANNIDVETVKKFIPVDEYITDLRVQKAIELVKENAVVDNTAADEKAE